MRSGYRERCPKGYSSIYPLGIHDRGCKAQGNAREGTLSNFSPELASDPAVEARRGFLDMGTSTVVIFNHLRNA